MFRIPKVNVIECDEGFSIEVLGRTGLRYTEGDRSIYVDSEVLNSTSIAIVMHSIATWDPPYEKESIDDGKRDSIIKNIRRAFQSQKKNIEVD